MRIIPLHRSPNLTEFRKIALRSRRIDDAWHEGSDARHFVGHENAI